VSHDDREENAPPAPPAANAVSVGSTGWFALCEELRWVRTNDTETLLGREGHASAQSWHATVLLAL